MAEFEIWENGTPTGAGIEADSLAQAVAKVVENIGDSGGFSPLGKFDVVPAGGRWIDRAMCSCEVEEDGGLESGPHLSIVAVSKSCDLHGLLPDPWEGAL